MKKEYQNFAESDLGATDEVANLFVTLAQEIHYKSVVNGLDMTSITECFNQLQEAYKRKMGGKKVD